jgi:hypothetical protein
MAIKINNNTIIDDSRNIVDAKIATAEYFDGFLPGGEKIYDENVTIDNGKTNISFEGDIVVETGNTLTIADGSSLVLNPFDVETSSVDELLVHKTLYVGRKAEFVTVGTGVGSITAASTSITGIQTTNNIAVGQIVKPIPGIIDPDTTISAASGTTITLSKASVNTSTQSDITFNFGYFDEEKSGIILDGEQKILKIGNTIIDGINNNFNISGGITFDGNSSNPNSLDEYEEGTWTPSFSTTDGNQDALKNALGTPDGWYVRIGKMLYVGCRIHNNSSNWAFDTQSIFGARIYGVPFACKEYYEPGGGGGGSAVAHLNYPGDIYFSAPALLTGTIITFNLSGTTATVNHLNVSCIGYIKD